MEIRTPIKYPEVNLYLLSSRRKSHAARSSAKFSALILWERTHAERDFLFLSVYVANALNFLPHATAQSRCIVENCYLVIYKLMRRNCCRSVCDLMSFLNSWANYLKNNIETEMPGPIEISEAMKRTINSQLTCVYTFFDLNLSAQRKSRGLGFCVVN